MKKVSTLIIAATAIVPIIIFGTIFSSDVLIGAGLASILCGCIGMFEDRFGGTVDETVLEGKAGIWV